MKRDFAYVCKLVKCVVCNRPICTVEHQGHEGIHLIPKWHFKGSELADGSWACSQRCWDYAVVDPIDSCKE